MSKNKAEDKKSEGSKEKSGWKIIIPIIIAIALAFVAIFVLSRSNSGIVYLNEGKTLMKDGKYDEAARKFRQYVDRNPDKEEGYVLLVQALMSGNHPNEAYYFLTQAKKRFPKSDQLILEMGRFYEGNMQPREAEKELNYYLKRHPKDPVALSILASAYMNMPDVDKAYETCKEIINLDPKIIKEHNDALTMAYLYLLEIIGNKGKTDDEAFSLINNALKSLPEGDKSRAYVALGIYYYKKDNLQESLKNFLAALEKDPENEAWANLVVGDIYEKQGDKEKALKYYNEFLKKFSDFSKLSAANLKRLSIYAGIGMNELSLDKLTEVKEKIKSLEASR